MNIDKAIEILQSGLITQQEQSELATILQTAVLAEREACAKLCEDQIKSYMSKRYTTDPLGGYRERFASEQCAKAIRARGNT